MKHLIKAGEASSPTQPLKAHRVSVVHAASQKESTVGVKVVGGGEGELALGA